MLALEDLHRHPRMVVLRLEQLLGQVEVGVRVVATSDALDRHPEDIRIEPLARGYLISATGAV